MANAKETLAIPEVNKLSYEQFISRYGHVVESCPWAAAVVWCKRPFKSCKEVHTRFSELLDELSQSGKEGILRLLPDLAGSLAQDGGLTSDSIEEHRAAGLDQLTADEQKLMTQLNEEYKAKFEFPFVICSRENRVEAIIKGLKERLKNCRDQEAIHGVNEVKKICNLRLRDLITET